MLARRNWILALALVATMTVGASSAFAQGDQNDDQTQPVTGGVEIDADGVLTNRAIDMTGALSRQRLRNARVNLNKDIQEVSKLRKVSLVKLERQVAALRAAGKPIPAEMKYLAGLTRITHVFFFPEDNDIVIAGPAEGFFVNGQNRVVGMKSGEATLHLEDLVAALRAFGPDGKKASLISCSIDPTQEGLANFQRTVQQVKAQYQGPHQAHDIARVFSQAIGHQTITITGVSPKTRFAQVLAEADYRMKLYGIGVDQPPVRITSFIDVAKPTSVRKNSLQRWFFQPNYDCVMVNEDQTAMHLDGSGVKLVGEDESVSAAGNRQRQGRANKATRTFCNSFTKNYEALSRKATLFGELRNMIDMSIAAAFIQKMDMYERAGWGMDTFADEGQFSIEIYPAPKKVAPVINAVVKHGKLMTPIGGGVNIQPRVALNSDRVSTDTEGKIDEVRDSITTDQLAETQWWWD